MKKIYRYLVNSYGEEEAVKINGKLLFINCPFKKSLKISSLPIRKFKKEIYARNLDRYQITCVNYLDYNLENIFFYILLNNIEKYDCFCFETAGFDFTTIDKTKQFLVQLVEHLNSKMVLIVVKEDSVEDNEILSEFPIYK